MASLLRMILIMYFSQRGANLGLSKRCLSGWRSLQPSKSSAPFTKTITLALEWHMVVQGNCKAAIVILTTFAACLRVSESLLIEIQDIAFAGDARIAGYEHSTAGINIKDAKTARYTGRLQFVKLDDPQTIKIIQAWTKVTNRKTGRMVTLNYQRYTANLETALSSLDLQNSQFTSHSAALAARIGKATQDYINGFPVDQIAINGRWKSINSLRHYVTNGRSWLLDTHIPAAAQNRISEAASNMQYLIENCPISLSG